MLLDSLGPICRMGRRCCGSDPALVLPEGRLSVLGHENAQASERTANEPYDGAPGSPAVLYAEGPCEAKPAEAAGLLEALGAVLRQRARLGRRRPLLFFPSVLWMRPLMRDKPSGLFMSILQSQKVAGVVLPKDLPHPAADEAGGRAPRFDRRCDASGADPYLPGEAVLEGRRVEPHHGPSPALWFSSVPAVFQVAALAAVAGVRPRT